MYIGGFFMGFFNFIWFILIGWWEALAHLILAGLFAITIVGIPIAKSMFQFAKLMAFPFGKEIIKETDLKGSANVSLIRKIFGTLVNIIWLPFGIIFAVCYFLSALVAFVTIVGIPVGVVYVRSAAFIIWPIGAKCVSKKQAYASAVANELERRNK